MSELKQRIDDDVKIAMRSRAKERLATLRMITAAIKQREVDERTVLDDQQIIVLLDKMARQHRESIEHFQQAGRDDLVAKEHRELQVVQEYLPAQLDESELSQLISDAIAAAGATTIKDMGKVMGILKPQVQGRADMGMVSNQIKQKLG
jgi:hypothetical protein